MPIFCTRIFAFVRWAAREGLRLDASEGLELAVADAAGTARNLEAGRTGLRGRPTRIGICGETVMCLWLETTCEG
jgi:hypothetical protein